MRENLILPFAEGLSLECKFALEILQQYFSTHWNRFAYFNQLDKHLAQISTNMQQMQQQNIFYDRMQQEQTMYDKYREAILQHAALCCAEAKETFFDERIYLLKCIGIFLNQSQRKESNHCTLFDDHLHAKLIRDKQMPQALLEGLIRNLEWEKDYKNDLSAESSLLEGNRLTPAQRREQLLLRLQSEQIEQLKILFGLYFKYYEPKPSEVALMLTYLKATLFSGSLGKHYRTVSESQAYLENQQIIADLGEITSMCMLRLHTSKALSMIKLLDVKEVWSTVTNVKELTQANSPLYFAIVKQTCSEKPDLAKTKEVIDFFNEMKTGSAIYQISQFLSEGSLLKHDMFKNKKGSFYLVIQAWLNLVFPFFKEHHLGQEMMATQQLAMQVLHNTENVEAIWAAHEQKPENLLNQLKMFENILTNPTKEIHHFLKICDALCGNQVSPFASKVLELIAKQEQNQTPFLAELFGWVVFNLQKLNNQLLDSNEVEALCSAFTVFSKIIKQRPDLYITLNKHYEKVINEYHNNDLQFNCLAGSARKFASPVIELQPFVQIEFDHPNQPFCSLLVRALHSFFGVEFFYSQRVICNLVDALAAIYDTQSLLRPLLMENIILAKSQDFTQCYMIDYFSRCYLDFESKAGKYKNSEKFINFLCKIFKHNFPQQCLNAQGQIELSTSFLAQSLEMVYLPMLQSYREFKFTDSAAFGSFIYRFLKLTRLMLEKFLDVPQTQKAKLHQPSPKFDCLLWIIVTTLNHLQVDKVCFSVLELQEVRTGISDRTRFENKWVIEGDPVKSEYQLSKLRKMVCEAFAVINTILKLALVDNDQQTRSDTKIIQDQMSLRSSYIQKLTCVQLLRSQIFDVNKSHVLIINNLNGTSVSTSLFGLFPHYLQHSEHWLSTMVEAQAMHFMTLACQLWAQLPDSRVPNLMLLLKQDTYSTQLQLQEIFVAQLQHVFYKEAESGSIRLCLQFIELLIVAADTQHMFIETMLNADSSISSKQLKVIVAEAFVHLIKSSLNQDQPALQAQVPELIVKLIVLFSLMAQRRVCLDLLAYRDYQLIQLLYDHGVHDLVFKLIIASEKNVKFDGEFIPPHWIGDANAPHKKNTCEARGMLVFRGCLAKVGLVYFMRLLTALYQREPSTKVVQSLIVKLFATEQFKSLPSSSDDSLNAIRTLSQLSQNVNRLLREDSHERDIQLQNDQLQHIHAYHSALVSQNETSTLQVMHDGGIFIDDLFGFDLYAQLARTPLYKLLAGSISPVFTAIENQVALWKRPGALGSEFFVSTREVKYTMQKEFFINQAFIAQTQSIYRELNLCMSWLHTDNELLKAKQEFMLRIGKTTQHISKEIGDALIQNTMIPLITTETVNLSNEETFGRFASQILSVQYTIAQTLFNQLVTRQSNNRMEVDQMATQNFFVLKLHENRVDNLVVALAAIAVWLHQPRAFKRPLMDKLDGRLKQDLKTLVEGCLLPRICEVFDFGCEDIVVGLHHVQTKMKSALRTGEQSAYEHFIQMALQTLQIYQVVHESMPEQDEQKRKRLDKYVIQILSKATQGMKKDVQFENCLKVIQIAFDLLPDELVQATMKKQDNQIIHEMYSRLQDQRSVTKPSELSAIYQLLTTYASTEQGAVHLIETHIMTKLQNSDCLVKLSNQDAYVTTQAFMTQAQTQLRSAQLQVRNPVHVQWCQLLVLLRTLNNSLLEDPSREHLDYFMQLTQLMQLFRDRFARMLHVGVHLSKQIDAQYNNAHSLNLYGLRDDQSQTMITLALLEETELIMDVLSQLFEQAHLWQEKDPLTFAQMKDYALFSVPKLLAFCETRSLQPVSVTENHLNSISAYNLNRANFQGQQLDDIMAASDQDFTGFSIKAENCLFKIFLSCSFSLLSCLLLTKEGAPFKRKIELIQTWFNPQTRRPLQSAVLTDRLISNDQGSDVLLFAFDTVYLAQERMLDRLLTLRRQDHCVKVFEQLTRLLHNDLWISQEYSSGLNYMLSASSPDISEIESQCETGLQMSTQVSCLLLETVRDALRSQTDRNPYAYSTYGGVDYRHDERGDVIRKAKELNDFIGRTEQEIKINVNSQGDFFNKLRAAIAEVDQTLMVQY